MTSKPAGLEDRLRTGLRGGKVEDLEHRPNSTFPWSKKGQEIENGLGGFRAEVWHSQLCQPWVPTVLSGVAVGGSQLLVRQSKEGPVRHFYRGLAQAAREGGGPAALLLPTLVPGSSLAPLVPHGTPGMWL